MFTRNLSANLLRICEERELSEAAAAEMCEISLRYFNKIICEKTNPSIITLQKLCAGLNVSPEELLLEQEKIINRTRDEAKCLLTTAQQT